MTVTRVCVAGAAGRMGRALIEAITAAPDLKLSGALEAPDSGFAGRDAGELAGSPNGVRIDADPAAALSGAHVLIDFTRPEPTLAHLVHCTRLGVKAVIGTTGFSAVQKDGIRRAAQEVSIVFAPNMSVGVNLTFRLIELAAQVLREGYDVEVIEAHHRHKVDAPSGTAVRMGEILATTLNRNIEQDAVYGRQGVTGERKPSTIGFATIRGGDIVGDHTALFAGIGERIEITHKASSRATFALGALRAARWLADKEVGLFDMQDVLGLR
jgi:4-hydroxy-tetrahydrodipicolinate reductase